MNTLAAAADFVTGRWLVDQPAGRSERIKLHVLDTLSAMLAGWGIEESTASRPLMSSYPLACICAAARSTEIDDIHLSSCTTPGSVVVPTALYLVLKGELGSWQEFAAAVLAGFELLIRLGFAIDGPAMLGKQIWPTYFAAPFGSAAVASRALKLSGRQTAGALATALAFCSGTPSAAAATGASSRCLSLGAAAANGVLAARCAAQGLLGSADILERTGGRIAGVEISEARLCDALGERFLFDDTGMKPYPVARQALAAIEAARELVDIEKIEANSISEIVIGVPAAQLRVIDRPEIPDSRFGSIVSAQYQVALALLMPERLFDVNRTPPHMDDRIRALMSKIRLQHAPELERYFPDAWPAHVEIQTRRERRGRTVIYPIGDARNRCDHKAVARKFKKFALSQLEMRVVENLTIQIREEAPPASLLNVLLNALPFFGGA